MRSTTRLLLCALTVLAVAAPATADPWVPVFHNEQVWVHCGSAAKAATARTTYNWNTTAPSTSFTANGGCGTLDTDKFDGEGVVYSGTHTGNLDRLTVHAWVIDAGPVRAGAYPEIYANVTVTIDGEDVIGGVEAHLVPIPSSTGLARRLEFSVTDIGLLEEEDYISHEVSVTLESAAYLDGDQVAWVLDATEVPSGLIFSPTPAQLAVTRLSANG